MELSELSAYAKERYSIEEQHKWADFPGFSVLCHPRSGKWLALLMRQWDTDLGEEIQRCDLKCGQQVLRSCRKSYLTSPVRMKGEKWVGIVFSDETEQDVIFRLFDRAVAFEEQHGYTIILDNKPSDYSSKYQDTVTPVQPREAIYQDTVTPVQPREAIYQDTVTPVQPREAIYQGTVIPVQPREVIYRDTVLPAPGDRERRQLSERQAVPERIRQMQHLYRYGRESMEAKAENFFRQGMYMQDYEDDAPWPGEFVCYFPTYHDLTTKQLRGYFSWRTKVRRGDYQPVSASAAYIYVYELLNGIGTSSAIESLERLKEFEKGFVDSGIGDNRIRKNLQRWCMDFAIVHQLAPDIVREYVDPEKLGVDEALEKLKNPDKYPDEEVFDALGRFGDKRFVNSPVIQKEKDRGRHLFAQAWRNASAQYVKGEDNLFALCFGKKISRRWYPFANAVYFWREKPGEITCAINACRAYRCRQGQWMSDSYESLGFNRTLFKGFLHQTDLMLRRYLASGHYLREKPEDAWAIPYVNMVIEEDRRAVLEASKPVIKIDLSGLDKIRRDALVTQESLLAEEFMPESVLDTSVSEQSEQTAMLTSRSAEPEQAAAFTSSTAEPEQTATYASSPARSEQAAEAADVLAQAEMTSTSSETVCGQPETDKGMLLTGLQSRILQELAKGGTAEQILRQEHLLASIVADDINEALLDEFGDIVIQCEDGKLSIVDDYREDIETLLSL